MYYCKQHGKKISFWQLPSAIFSSMQCIKSNHIHDIETENKPLAIDLNENEIDVNTMTIILANGQPLLTNFEEKYLIDTIVKTLNKDIERILEEKNSFYSTNELYFTIIIIYIKLTLDI
ncbi:unnamed protein product [Rotaria sp. Silwood2]|nr:unnamed protein product [Rotaria sp. Silwood2]